MSRDNKLVAGITLAIIKKLIARDSAEYYEQNRNDLYAILGKAGWVYDNSKRMWKERTIFGRKSPVKVMNSPVPTAANNGHRVASIALIRVIAPREEMDYILSQLNELFPCLDGEIQSTSREYQGDGNWVRVYLKVEFKRSINHEQR